jgi:prepilin-type N-terminal cleavage/methylation domain-containing protein
MAVRRRDSGFTLLELMISVALMSVVILWLTQTFTVQHRTYTVVEQVTETQQNSLAVASLLEREIRSAGFLVPENAAVCGLDNTNASDILYVSAADILDPTGVDNPDLGLRLAPGASAGFNEGDGTVARTLRLENRFVDDGDDVGFFDVDGDGTNDADWTQNMGVIIVDENNTTRGTACGRVTFVPDPPGTIMNVTVDYDTTMDGAASPTASIRAIPAHIYRVDANNNLLRNGDVLAPDVEDFQVSYFYDRDLDDLVDANERPGSGIAGEPIYDMADGVWQGNELRELHLAIVVRTQDPDPNTNFTDGAFQPTENRVAPAGNDGFRRRVYTSTVRVRNVGSRD